MRLETEPEGERVALKDFKPVGLSVLKSLLEPMLLLNPPDCEYKIFVELVVLSGYDDPKVVGMFP